MKGYAIITGASRGVGESLARECARRGYHLILISLPDEGLQEVSSKLSGQYEVKAETYETDLTEPEAVDKFFDWCLQHQLPIQILINNAGLGMQGKFEHSPPGMTQKMMQINMDALVSMCRKGLPLLKRQEKSYILNVASIGSFMPVPYKAVYTSTKHFVRNFTAALHYELKYTSVFAACLCPGPVLTSSEHKKKVKEAGLVARLLTMEREEVARRAIEGLLKEKRMIIPGMANKLLVRLSWLLPDIFSLKLAARTFENSSFNHK